MAETTSRSTAEEAPRRKRRRWPYVLGAIAAIIVVVAILFRWDWFLPLVESRASAALGRRVTAEHMHVQLGRVTRITFDGVRIANPDGWPGGGDFATAQHLTVALDAATLLRTRQVVIPTIALDHSNVDAVQQADGKANWDFNLGGGSGGGTPPKIGDVQITAGTAHVIDPKLRADFQLAVNTEEGQGAEPELHATAKGTYAGQPITGEFTGGALLSLRDTAHPYPVNLQLANGPTRVSLVGTVQDPLSFEGADLKLALQGPDMRLLYPLTGVPIPQTPPYKIAGNLDYQAGRVRFTHFEGTVGQSDLGGDIAVTTTGKPGGRGNARLAPGRSAGPRRLHRRHARPLRRSRANAAAARGGGARRGEQQADPGHAARPAQAQRRRRPPEIQGRPHPRPRPAARQHGREPRHRGRGHRPAPARASASAAARSRARSRCARREPG